MLQWGTMYLYMCKSRKLSSEGGFTTSLMTCWAGYAADLPAKVQIWRHNDCCFIVACGVQCRRCWRACNTILSQQQALAKQAQKHTACLEAHDQIRNYSCLSVWSVYFCLTPVLWINRIVITSRDPWTNTSLLTSFLNSNKPRKTTTEEEHEQHDTFCTWKLHSWMSWVRKKLATNNSTKSSTCFWSASFLDQECPGNGHWL